MSEDRKYYVRRQGQVAGPWPMSKLEAEVKLRKLARYHEISEDGKSWVLASTIEELFLRSDTRKFLPTSESTSGKRSNQTDADAQTETGAAKEWYCEVNGEQRGPLSHSEVRRLILDGVLMLDNLVWREGFSDWLPVESVSELSSDLNVDGRSRDNSGYTDATQLVTMPVEGQQASGIAKIGFVMSVVLFFLTCIPGVGLLGIVPVGLCGYAWYESGKTSQPVSRLAFGGIGIGLAAVLFNCISIALGGAAVLKYLGVV